MRSFPRYAEHRTVVPYYDSLAWRERYNPLPDLTPDRAVELYSSWREGRYADVMFTFDALEEWDDVLGTLVDRRLSALGELDHGIRVNAEAVGEDGDLQRLADDQQCTMSEIVNRVVNMSEAIGHLGLATFRGFAHLEEVVSGDEIRLEPVDQWFWNRPMKRGNWFYNPTAGGSLSELHPVNEGELIIRTESRPVDLVALFAITIKAHSEAGWDGFIDVFGNPALFFEYPPGTSDEKAAEYDEIMFKLLGDGRGGYPNGGKIVPVETAAQGGATFQDRVVFANKKMIMRATGGTLTSLAESGTGTLAGEAQMEVFRTLAKAEARKISEVISKQFVNRWLDRLYPGKPRLVYWAMDAEDEQGKMAHVEKIAKMAAVGYRAEDDEVSELIGMRVSYREPEVPGMPGEMMPGVGGVIRNREGAGSVNEPYEDTERLLTELDEDAIKRRAELYAKKLETAAVNGLGLAVDEMTAQTAAEEGDESETDNESRNGRYPVATPLQNAGNGQDEAGDGLLINHGTSEGAKKGWDKRGRGRSDDWQKAREGMTPRQNVANAIRAMRWALNNGKDAQNVMYRKGLGWVDFPIGRAGTPKMNTNNVTHADGYGLKHILAKHGDRSVRRMPLILACGKIEKHSDLNKLTVSYGNELVHLGRSKGRGKSWVITSYDENKKGKRDDY